MVGKDQGSLTKEPPLATLDATIRAVTPGMSYASLLAYARSNTHKDAPGLISKRYLTVERNGTIAYDHFLSLAATHGLESSLVRKVMYFLWAYRDERIRRFICEKIADKNGRWRTTALLNKANATFFERWLQSSTARKARSNFEFYLIETRIFDPKSRTINLELNDGWLQQAAIAAAQHEDDARLREELLADPIGFLEKRNWLGLLNTSRADLPEISPILSTDSLPREDDEIKSSPPRTPTSNNWDRASPTFSGKKAGFANIDLVARERANKSHYMLEEILANIAKRNGYSPMYNQNIDMYFNAKGGTVLAEIKSCTDSNFHSQIRKGISQLFEYRFLYKQLFASEVTPLLVMEAAPPNEKDWLIGYVESLGIVLAWKNLKTKSIVSKSDPPEILEGIVIKS